jgi:hypothetical protein
MPSRKMLTKNPAIDKLKNYRGSLFWGRLKNISKWEFFQMKIILMTFAFLMATLHLSTLAVAVEYTFTRVYTGTVSPGVAINDNGLVALIGGSSSPILLTTDGHVPTVIAGPTALNHLDFMYDSMQALTLNNDGFVAFHGIAPDGKNGILASDGTVTRKIAASTSNGGAFYEIHPTAVSINDAGKVAFTARLTSTYIYNIFVGDGTSNAVMLNDHFSSLPAINNSGTVAYEHWNPENYSLTTEIQRGIDTFALPSSTPGEVEYLPDINDFGQVANAVSASSVIIGDGVSSPRYIDGSLYLGKLDGNGLSMDGGMSCCAINNDGLVVFGAHPQAFSGGIIPAYGLFTGPNPVADKVIMEGDVLDGATINKQSLFFSRGGLNNKGQIAFRAQLSDGTSGVWVASPVPEPASLLLVASGVVGFLAYGYRQRKRIA